MITLCIEARNGKRLQTRTQKLTWLALGWGQTKRKLPSLCERRMCHSICDCSATDVYWILFGERSEARNIRNAGTFGGRNTSIRIMGVVARAAMFVWKYILWAGNIWILLFLESYALLLSICLCLLFAQCRDEYCTLWSHICVAWWFTMPQSSINMSNCSEYAAKERLAKQHN